MDWEQRQAWHCPEPQCKGMILESDEVYYVKCSDCGKYFMTTSEMHEVDEEGHFIDIDIDKNDIIEMLEDVYNDLQFFDQHSLYDPEEQACEIQIKIRDILKLMREL